MGKIWTWIKGRFNNLPLFLLTFIAFWGGLMLIPVSIPLRDQRMENVAYAMFMATAVYTFQRISKPVGLVLLYIGFISVMSFVHALESFMVIYTFVIMFIGMVSTYGEWGKSKETIYDCLIFIVICNVIFQILQHQEIYFISYPIDGTSKYHCGLMNNINDLSCLYAVCFPVFLRKNRWFLLPILFTGLYMSSTLTGVLVTACVLITYIIIRTRNPRITFGVLSIVFLLVTLYATYVENFDMEAQKRGRLYIWSKTAQVASVKKTGWGIDQFEKVMPLVTSFKYIDEPTRRYLYAQIYDKTSFDKALAKVSNNDISYFFGDKLSPTYFLQAHNEWLEIWFIGGPVLILLALWLAITSLWTAFKNKQDRIPFYGLLSAYGSATLFFTWHIVPIALITVLYLGMVEGEKWQHQTHSTGASPLTAS